MQGEPIGGVRPAEHELAQVAFGEHVGDGPPDVARRRAQQQMRLVVDQAEPAARIDCDHAFADAVQRRLALLDERGDLVQLQPERLPLEPAGEQ
jgi:hypothetical protein